MNLSAYYIFIYQCVTSENDRMTDFFHEKIFFLTSSSWHKKILIKTAQTYNQAEYYLRITVTDFFREKSILLLH